MPLWSVVQSDPGLDSQCSHSTCADFLFMIIHSKFCPEFGNSGPSGGQYRRVLWTDRIHVFMLSSLPFPLKNSRASYLLSKKSHFRGCNKVLILVSGPAGSRLASDTDAGYLQGNLISSVSRSVLSSAPCRGAVLTRSKWCVSWAA